MATPQFYETEITEIKEIAPSVKDITFSYIKPKEMIFKAGQFATLQLYDDEGNMVSRAYSIASGPSDTKKLHLCIKIIPGGKGTEIIDKLKVGDKVKMFGPGGFFTLDSKTKNHIFICTGTGIAPFVAMLEEALITNKSKDNFQVICGVRTQEDILYEDVLKNLAEKYPNFSYTVCLSREDVEKHFSGRVTMCITGHIKDFQANDYYICGVGEMVNEVIEILVNQNVSDEQIHYERYS